MRSASNRSFARATAFVLRSEGVHAMVSKDQGCNDAGTAREALVWLGGEVLPISRARISPLDRGFLFGDGVYEVVRFFSGVGIGLDLHVARLGASLSQLRISGLDPACLRTISRTLLDANGLTDAAVYLQVSRGTASVRSHIPPAGIEPTIFAVATPCGGLEELERITTVHCAAARDERWLRCAIKSTSLLGSVLPMVEHSATGAEEVILVRDGLVIEGTSSNVFVEVDGVLVTPPLNSEPSILHGVMRTRLLEGCIRGGVPCAVRPVTEAQLHASREVIVTASKRIYSAVTRLGDQPVGDGTIGPLARRAHAALLTRLREEVAVGAAGVDDSIAGPSASATSARDLASAAASILAP